MTQGSSALNTDAHFPTAPTGKVNATSSGKGQLHSIAMDAQRSVSRSPGSGSRQSTPTPDCQQEPWLTFYFDGTGNNEKVDTPTKEHSNVARLHRVRKENNPAKGLMSFYIPGIGTPFKEIGDTGGDLSAAVASGGQARLDWAWSRFEEQVKAAVARATNPVAKIRMIHVAVFGFSRGAALARAFAVKLQAATKQGELGWQLRQGNHPVRLYFMGLFDTVASVGVPAAARKYQMEATAAAPFIGAIPVLITAMADGHASWASDLRIPPMAERCVHYVAAHEIRNSFPLDTALDHGRYGSQVTECVYPGVHSNVGGGYRPGEGGRLANPFGMLSAIPLQAMYDEAYKIGVPLRTIQSLKDSGDEVYTDFMPPTEEDKKVRNALIQRFNKYMTAIGRTSQPIGQTVSAHMKMYFRWRIVDVGRKLNAKANGTIDTSSQRQATSEAAWAKEKASKQKRLTELNAQYRDERMKADYAANNAYSMPTEALRQQSRQQMQAHQARAQALKDEIVMQEASLNTMPGTDGSLAKNLATYDKQFLEDSQRVRTTPKDSLKGFDRVLRAAWDEPTLSDADILAFFDDHVIDSLAGFAKDRTRATEPRVLYQGGDDELKYAAASQPSRMQA